MNGDESLKQKILLLVAGLITWLPYNRGRSLAVDRLLKEVEGHVSE